MSIYSYEGVCVAKVTGLIEGDSPVEARDRLHNCEFGAISDIALQPLALMDELAPADPDEDSEEEDA